MSGTSAEPSVEPAVDAGQPSDPSQPTGEPTERGARWLQELDDWLDPDGRVWLRGHPRWLTESDAARLQLRANTMVALELRGLERLNISESGRVQDVTWLSPEERKAFWRRKVAGHLDTDNGAEPPLNEDGVTFRASLWTEEDGEHRLILISRFR